MEVLPLIILRRKFVDQQTFGFCGRVPECLLNYCCTFTISVPYKVIIIAPKSGSKESVVMDKVFNLYDLINGHKAFSGDVIIDDIPGMTVGLKLRNAKKMGYPFIILFGKESINSVIELYDYKSMIKIPIDQVLVHLKSINISA